MKAMIYLLPTVAALSAPLSRRNAITGSLAAAAMPGASNAAPSAAVIGYDDVVLDLPCGARVPALFLTSRAAWSDRRLTSP